MGTLPVQDVLFNEARGVGLVVLAAGTSQAQLETLKPNLQLLQSQLGDKHLNGVAVSCHEHEWPVIMYCCSHLCTCLPCTASCQVLPANRKGICAMCFWIYLPCSTKYRSHMFFNQCSLASPCTSDWSMTCKWLWQHHTCCTQQHVKVLLCR